MKNIIVYLLAKIIYATMKWGTSDIRKELISLRENDYDKFIERRKEVKEEVDKRLEEIGNDDPRVTDEYYRLFGIIV